MNDIIDKLKNLMPPWRKRYIRISMDISAQIVAFLKEENMTQQDLAVAMGKHKSEISKYLSGTHNFTIQTIAKIEEVLHKEIILVPKFAQKDLDSKRKNSSFKENKLNPIINTPGTLQVPKR